MVIGVGQRRRRRLTLMPPDVKALPMRIALALTGSALRIRADGNIITFAASVVGAG